MAYREKTHPHKRKRKRNHVYTVEHLGPRLPEIVAESVHERVFVVHQEDGLPNPRADGSLERLLQTQTANERKVRGK